MIRGDPARFRQVLVNLVNNAITYTERGEVFVRVTYEEPRSRLHVAVLDSGVGIPPEKLEHVFDAFQQADSSSTRRFGGTGLGLTICRELVGLMGGEIAAASEVGVGSTFSFQLPVEALPESDEAREHEAGWIAQLDGARVLVVDDNRTNRTLMTELLRSVKAEPVLAASAADGFERLLESQRSGSPIERVVSDVRMPEEDGYSFAARIRREPGLQAVRIVLLTSALEDIEPERRAALGPVTRLMKPVKHSELLDALTVGPRPDRAPQRRPATAASEGESGPERALRILLVEDSRANQKLVLAILGELGYRIRVGRALEALEREAFDAVLMDVHIPKMDGYEATRRIRAAEARSGRRVPIPDALLR